MCIREGRVCVRWRRGGSLYYDDKEGVCALEKGVLFALETGLSLY